MADRPEPATIRALRAENPKARARDFAALHGITEAELVAAWCGQPAGPDGGQTVTRIDATPAQLVPMICDLGDVLALTRNESCVHERRGAYQNFQPGDHAAVVLGAEIDLRLFPAYWVHGFAVEETTAEGIKRSLQIFDAHGDAVHKVHLKPESDVAAYGRLVAALRRADAPLALTPRPATESAKADPARAEALRAEWDRMTDTHQFVKLTRKLRMNRLGAYRIAGAPYAQPLATDAVTRALTLAAEDRIPLMIFVGNPGCIQIHGGVVEKIVPMGPWINVMDPRFNLHLRADHIAEVWLVNKPTRHGAAISVEAFDADGGLILQIFGQRSAGGWDAWNALTLTLPAPETAPQATAETAAVPA
ncbi:MAG TPA: ChuX/HutX family heme-like substrate-binding protein [Paracoccaceae bacterium]